MDLYSYVDEGDPIPVFRTATLDGQPLDTGDPGAKTWWIYFFIIACPYCREGMKFLEQELKGEYKKADFRFVAIGRDHSAEELIAFRERKQISFPLVADPGRKIYQLFATQKVPRSILFGPDGVILKHSKGFNPGEYSELVNMVRKI